MDGQENNAAIEVGHCSQCGRPPVWQVASALLCVDCFHKFEVARTLDFRIAAIGMNYAAAEMDRLAPFGGMSPRIQVPEIPRGATILNNIKVDNSVVGAINTGNVESIDVNISYLKKAGGDEVSAALVELTEAIASAKDIDDSQKRSLIDQVEFVSEQAVKGAEGRRPGMISAALSALDSTAKATASLSAIWNSIHPILRHFFGMS
ncbi:hypothetical protein HJB72_01820 [Rhizobium lentis]|uniref:hypothetical protein n=1 Tax=Rhizobium TaxID=379 RepID=UPI001C830102|nr:MULTISPECIES: hypothetical protein [Rhizobium]MBX4996729.1 hypothetical protein [Rhizobium lentis]MBX5213056.1 hypothetical protein [Rhizobium sp. NLR9a]